MMLSARELARVFFAGESDEARIVAADTFDECEHLGTASIAIGVFDGVHRGHQNSSKRLSVMPVPMAVRRSWLPSIPTRTLW
ncbi:MAG: hypothetical protein ACLTYW_11745 [Collinsella sp.]